MKLSYKEQVYQSIKQGYKEKNAEKIVYYKNALNFAACAKFEDFKKSSVYTGWIAQNTDKIESIERELNFQNSY